MIISKKWLSQYMDIDDLSMEEIADRITSAGLEVEGMEKMSQGTNLIIGKVLTCVDHPDSDHLHVCQVDLGETQEQIVCGAPNVAAGQKVIVARVGAQLPGGEIKAGVIRGQASNGMICSLLELGVDAHQLSEESKNGIEVLDEDAPVGNTNPLGYLGLDDEILDVGLTPNRNDCMAAWAMAKETGAVLNRKVTLPDCEGIAMRKGEDTKLHVASESERCPLFMGKVINHITIKPSPKWMKELLMAAGIKSINNVVDISNIVMLETGQPMHFYDKNALPAQEITVKDNFDTTYTALDGIEYKIEPGDLMITTVGKPIGIAGIMGGDDSKIEATTTGIILEAAIFNHVSIRNTSRRLNLGTDASVRYQKGIEPMATYKAMDRAVQLLVEYADASGIEDTVIAGSNHYTPTEITVNLGRINHLLGTDFDEAEVMDVLQRLELQPEKVGDDIHMIIPSYRQDLEIEADIAEEIIRILGYDRLASTLPTMPATMGALDQRQALRRRMRTLLTSLGYQEAITYTLVSQKLTDDAILPLPDPITLASPMSEDRKYIRRSILPSLLGAMSYNQARSIKDIALFEMSNVYGNGLVEERMAITMAGDIQKSRWQKLEISSNFYTMKGLLEELLASVGYEGKRVVCKENTMDTTHFHPYQSACLYIGKDLFAIFGTIHPQMAKDYEVSNVIMAEVNLEVLLKNKAGKVKYTPMSKYPQVSQDLAFVVKEDVNVGAITACIEKNGKLEKENIIKNVEVFDVYTGEHVEVGYKSIALSVTFQSATHTLADKEITQMREQLLTALEKDVHAQLRS